MSDIRIWPTLTGAVILTPEAIGFGFFEKKDFDKLQADLEAGVPLHEAVGVWSGSVYPLDRLRRVYLKERSKRVIIEWKELVLSASDDFNFHTARACQEFYDALMYELGPEFRVRASRPGLGTLILGIGALLIGLLHVFTLTQNLLGWGPPPKQPLTPAVNVVIGSIGLVFLVLGVYWLRKFAPRKPMPSEDRQPRS